MSTPEDRPQLYLLTPAAFDPAPFSAQLASVLDAMPVACVRLSMGGNDEDAISRAADTLREITHARDIALVIERHVLLAEKLGLDGVHLPKGNHGLRKLRETLGDEAIIGQHGGTSRHEGIAAAEAGADYISFGPVGETPLGDGAHAGFELFEWWSEMIEVPVVAEGALNRGLIETLAPVTDFFAIGDEIWRHEDPLAALRDLVAPLGY